MLKKDKKYYAFISYSHKDEEWAKWLQHEFEHYHLPTTLNGLTDVPDKFHPIFRDIDELSGGELKPQISHALRASAYLVIICSPNSAKSPYVDGEIREFIEIGEQNGINNISNIFPFIIEGTPHSTSELDKECFPKALRDLPSELIAGDVTKHGREHAFVKILSGTLHHSHIGFNMLWNQFERDRIEEERKEREKRDRLLLLESRYFSEKALDIASVDSRLAKMLLLRALPKNLDDPEDRPYCFEAESALRKIYSYKSAIFNLQQLGVNSLNLNTDGSRGVSTSSDGTLRIWDLETESQVGEPLKGHVDGISHAIYSHNGKIIASCYEDCTIILWDAEMGKQIGILKDAPKQIKRIAFTHDDSLLIAMSCVHSSDNTLVTWNMEEQGLVYKIPIPYSNDMAIDKDNRWIALASLHFAIVIYDLKDGKMIKEIPKAHSESLYSVDFSPDGKNIVSASPDGKFKIWDWRMSKVILERNVGKVRGAYAEVVHSSKYSNDGKYIVTVSWDHIIRIWNATTGELHGKPLVDHTDVHSAYFSHDGRCIISKSLDGTVRIWDLNPQAPYRIVGRAMSIPFDLEDNKSVLSPDKKLIATKNNNVLKVLDANNKLQIGPSFTLPYDIYEFMFLKSGRGIITETERDYDILIDWLPLQELINETREQVKTRHFTEDEKKRYYIE